MRIFTIKLRVDFGDCDPAGIVFYPNFYRWFDRATHQMFRDVGYTFFQLKEEHGLVAWPLVDTGAKFLSPASVGDDLELHSGISEWGRKTFRISHQIKRGGELLVDGFELRILGKPADDNPRKLRAVEIPEAMRLAFGE